MKEKESDDEAILEMFQNGDGEGLQKFLESNAPEKAFLPVLGPINKSQETKDLEALVTDIIQSKDPKYETSLEFQHSEDKKALYCIVSKQGELREQINVTDLLQKADFTHLSFPQKLYEAFTKNFESKIRNGRYIDGTNVEEVVPDMHKKFIKYYTSEQDRQMQELDIEYRKTLDNLDSNYFAKRDIKKGIKKLEEELEGIKDVDIEDAKSKKTKIGELEQEKKKLSVEKNIAREKFRDIVAKQKLVKQEIKEITKQAQRRIDDMGSLSTEEKFMLYMYTKGSGTFNNLFRDRDPDNIEFQIAAASLCSAVCAKLPTYSVKYSFRREKWENGEKNENLRKRIELIETGGIEDVKGFSSTADAKPTFGGASDEYNTDTIFINLYGVDVSPISYYPHEKEFLIPPMPIKFNAYHKVAVDGKERHIFLASPSTALGVLQEEELSKKQGERKDPKQKRSIDSGAQKKEGKEEKEVGIVKKRIGYFTNLESNKNNKHQDRNR